MISVDNDWRSLAAKYASYNIRLENKHAYTSGEVLSLLRDIQDKCIETLEGKSEDEKIRRMEH